MLTLSMLVWHVSINSMVADGNVCFSFAGAKILDERKCCDMKSQVMVMSV